MIFSYGGSRSYGTDICVLGKCQGKVVLPELHSSRRYRALEEQLASAFEQASTCRLRSKSAEITPRRMIGYVPALTLMLD